MEATIQSVNFIADVKLKSFIQRRLDKLDLFHEKVINAQVYLKILNTTSRLNKITEIKIHVPGKDLLVSKRANSFEKCADACCSALERKLKKDKQKKYVQ